MPTSDYSRSEEGSLYEGIKAQACLALMALAASSEHKAEGFIRTRYEANWTSYNRTAELLEAAGLLKRNDGVVVTSTAILEEEFPSRLLDGLRYSQNPHRKELEEFLRHFQRGPEGLDYCPNDLVRSRHSSVRNFLLELKMLKTVNPGAHYRWSASLNGAVYSLLRPKTSTSSAALQESISSKKNIGLSAEEALVHRERELLGAHFAHYVEHVSLTDSEAGFDVASVRIQQSLEEPLQIFFEVKAVSPVDWSFFLTRNELHAAKYLGEQYCLLLVPVISSGVPDITGARELWNPTLQLEHLNMEPASWRCCPAPCTEH
jgi:hypothetical protein